MQTKIIVIIVLMSDEKLPMQRDKPEIQTTLGKIMGSTMETRLGKTIYAFRGIPYAEPPTGYRRFKQAVPTRAWSGTLDASKEGPACPQVNGTNLSENCLTLNVYIKQFRVGERLPVIVFLHPGGFYRISSQSNLFGPQYLLDSDVVLVTVNYRLSSLGFLSTGTYHAPGNLGFKDQVAALRFIQQHIASFGGDPNSVTLTGQSSGSRSIILHMISPMSKGLFHKAIAMSGSLTTPIPAPRAQIDLAVKQAQLLNCTTRTMDEMIGCLMGKPAHEFGQSVTSFYEWRENPTTIWYGVIEPIIPGVERFLSDRPETLMKLGQIHNVPLIIGVTTDEFGYKASQPIELAKNGDSSFFDELTQRWEELAPICFQYEPHTDRTKYINEELLKYYFNGGPITLSKSEALQKLYGNALVHFPVHRAATLMAKYSPAPVFFYEFSYQGRYSYFISDDTKTPNAGVAHGDDLQYIFGIRNDIYHKMKKFPIFNDNDPEIRTVKRLTTMWTHFAKTGDPLPTNTELFGNITWERLTPQNKSYLNIGKDLVIKTNFLSETMQFWSNLFP